jgi:hypothetical protein
MRTPIGETGPWQKVNLAKSKPINEEKKKNI